MSEGREEGEGGGRGRERGRGEREEAQKGQCDEVTDKQSLEKYAHKLCVIK